jgi:hypothetical protein
VKNAPAVADSVQSARAEISAALNITERVIRAASDHQDRASDTTIRKEKSDASADLDVPPFALTDKTSDPLPN